MKKIRIICLCFALVLLVGAISCMFLIGSTWAKYSAASEGTATLKVAYGETRCTGGTATCTQKATCEICGNEYGDYGHTGNKVWSYSESGHWQLWDCCGSISGDIEEHTYVDNKCTTCGRENHTHEPVAVPAKEATCTEEGNIAYQACECGKMWNADGTIEILPTSVTIPASGHKWYLATCLEPKTCQNCGETEGVALEHNLQTLEAVEPTCTSTGLTEGKYCTLCNTVTVPQQVREMTAHDTKVIPAVAATCTQGGMTAGEICKVCGTVTVLPEATEAAGHSKTTLPAVAATCTATGLTEGEKCTVCGLITVEQEVTDALGHHEVATPALEPTCTQAGHTAGTRCDRAGCNTVLKAQETIAATGHTEVAMADVAPTCTDKGYEGGKQCSVCYTITVARTELAALGHLNDVEIEEVAPTCADTGLTAGVQCSRCGTLTTPQTIIPATGHTEETLEGRAPTCLSVGISEGKRCSVCGDIIVAQTILPKSGHTETTLPAKAATCTATGLTEGKQCSVCGVITVAQQTVEKLAHTVVTDAAVAATCTTAGKTEGSHCSVCNTVLVAQTTVPATGHSWSDATCTTPKTCSVCEATEGSALGHTAASSYSSDTSSHWKECTVCGYDIDKTAHTSTSGGTSSVHTKCSVCSKTLSSTHSYSYTCNNNSTHKKTCSCGYSVASENCTAASGYEYDANYHFQLCEYCDTQIANTVTAHTWDNVCDSTCNGGCGYTRSASHNIKQNTTTGVVCCMNGCGTSSSTPQTYYSSSALYSATHGGFTNYLTATDNAGWGSYLHAQATAGIGAVIQLDKATTTTAMGQFAVIQYCGVKATTTNNDGKNFAIQVNNGGTMLTYYIPVMSGSTWGAQVLQFNNAVHNNHFYLNQWNTDIFISHIAFFSTQAEAEAYAKFLQSYPIDGYTTRAFGTIANNGVTSWS